MRMLSPLSTQWTAPRRTLSPTLMVGDMFEDLGFFSQLLGSKKEGAKDLKDVKVS